MSRAWRTIKGYIFWTYERGSFHYDVMVSFILLFIFISPHLIDFKDLPPDHIARDGEIVVTSDGARGFIYQVDAAAVDAQDEGAIRTNVARLLRPVSGSLTVTRIEPVRDSAGRILAYKAWTRR